MSDLATPIAFITQATYENWTLMIVLRKMYHSLYDFKSEIMMKDHFDFSRTGHSKYVSFHC